MAFASIVAKISAPLASRAISATRLVRNSGTSDLRKEGKRKPLFRRETAVDVVVSPRGLTQQLLQEDPQELGCMPVSTKP